MSAVERSATEPIVPPIPLSRGAQHTPPGSRTPPVRPPSRSASHLNTPHTARSQRCDSSPAPQLIPHDDQDEYPLGDTLNPCEAAVSSKQGEQHSTIMSTHGAPPVPTTRAPTDVNGTKLTDMLPPKRPPSRNSSRYGTPRIDRSAAVATGGHGSDGGARHSVPTRGGHSGSRMHSVNLSEHSLQFYLDDNHDDDGNRSITFRADSPAANSFRQANDPPPYGASEIQFRIEESANPSMSRALTNNGSELAFYIEDQSRGTSQDRGRSEGVVLDVKESSEEPSGGIQETAVFQQHDTDNTNATGNTETAEMPRTSPHTAAAAAAPSSRATKSQTSSRSSGKVAAATAAAVAVAAASVPAAPQRKRKPTEQEKREAEAERNAHVFVSSPPVLLAPSALLSAAAQGWSDTCTQQVTLQQLLAVMREREREAKRRYKALEMLFITTDMRITEDLYTLRDQLVVRRGVDLMGNPIAPPRAARSTTVTSRSATPGRTTRKQKKEAFVERLYPAEDVTKQAPNYVAMKQQQRAERGQKEFCSCLSDDDITPGEQQENAVALEAWRRERARLRTEKAELLKQNRELQHHVRRGTNIKSLSAMQPVSPRAPINRIAARQSTAVDSHGYDMLATMRIDAQAADARVVEARKALEQVAAMSQRQRMRQTKDKKEMEKIMETQAQSYAEMSNDLTETVQRAKALRGGLTSRRGSVATPRRAKTPTRGSAGPVSTRKLLIDKIAAAEEILKGASEREASTMPGTSRSQAGRSMSRPALLPPPSPVSSAPHRSTAPAAPSSAYASIAGHGAATPLAIRESSMASSIVFVTE